MKSSSLSRLSQDGYEKESYDTSEYIPGVTDEIKTVNFFQKNNFAFQSMEVQDVLIVSLVAQYLSVHFGNDSE